MPVLLEVCVGDPVSLAAAVQGGADRIELCSALELGGLTPAPGLMQLAAKAPVPVYALVRPRGGEFVFGAREVESMLADIAAVRAAGLSGVALGASRPGGSLDAEVLRELAAASVGLGRTLHRAFDLVPDLDEAVELAIELGFERILTSGRARTAPEGMEEIGRAHGIAGRRIAIMAGSGLNARNVGALLAQVPLMEVHGSCSLSAGEPDRRIVELGFAPPGPARRTSADEVRRFRQALQSFSGSGITP